MKKQINIALVVLDDALISTVTGIEDILYLVNKFIKNKDEPELNLSYLSLDEDVKLSNSIATFKTKKINNDFSFDVVIIPPVIRDIKYLFEYKDLIIWLKNMHKKGSILCSVCVGAFVLAQTGLLDYKEATTHWLFEKEFKLNFPKIKLRCDKLVVNEDNIITAGGMNAYLNLMMIVLKRYYSAHTIYRCSSFLLIDTGRTEQTCYKDSNFNFSVADKELNELLQWIKNNLHKELTIELMAKRIGLHQRTLLRRFKKVLDITPNNYLQNLRIEEAKFLLISTNKSFSDITYSVGFFNESSFRRLFKIKTSLNPGEYRRKFKA